MDGKSKYTKGNLEEQIRRLEESIKDKQASVAKTNRNAKQFEKKMSASISNDTRFLNWLNEKVGTFQ